jgi:ribosome maturation factor RimP
MHVVAKQNIEQSVEEIVQTIIAGSDLELVDVEYIKERDWYLRVFLDKEQGIEIEDCQWVSERLEAKLDELDPIKDSYYLEVSSPGLDRPLKKDKDFLRHIGNLVEINTFAPVNGLKQFTGTLKNFTSEGNITIEIDGTDMDIHRSQVAQVRLHIEF